MGKRNAFSYLVFFIALVAQIIDYLIEYVIKSIDQNYYYDHFLQWTLLLIVGGPIIGIVLALYAKRGNHRWIAIALNVSILIAFGPLALLNLWIMTFGIW